MDGKAQISGLHFWAMNFTATASGALLLLPAAAIDAGGRMAWLVTVLAGVVGFGTALLIGNLSRRFPDLTFTGYAQRLIGRWPGRVLGLVLGLGLSLHAAVGLRAAIRNAIGIYFLTTPTWAIALVSILPALAVVWYGIVHASRLGPLMAAGMVLTFLFSFPLLWRWMQPGYLIPLLDWPELEPSRRQFWVALGTLQSGLYLTALMPYVAGPQKALRRFGWSYGAAWLGLLPAVLAPVLVFSPAGARALDQPFPFVVAVLRLPNFPFERLELVARLAYNLNVLYAVAVQYFCGGVLLAGAFGSRRVRPFMLAAAAVSFLSITLVSADQPAEVFSAWVILGSLAFVWTVFPLLWAACWLRGRHRRPRRPGAPEPPAGRRR